MHLEIVWDDANEDHATKREIAEAIADAPGYVRGSTGGSDRARIVGTTRGGRRLIVIVQLRGDITVRPITAFDERK